MKKKWERTGEQVQEEANFKLVPSLFIQLRDALLNWPYTLEL